LTNSVANSIFYNYGGSTLHVFRFKALTQVICPGDFRVAWSFFARPFVLFLYKFRKKTSFSPAYRSKINLHVSRLKALTKVICPGDFRVAWSFFTLRFVLSTYNFSKKHHFHEHIVQKPIDQFRCKFNFVQLWRAFFTCSKF
jgi:hypothetical protein